MVTQREVSAGASGLDLCISMERVDRWRPGGASLKAGHMEKIPRSDVGLGASDHFDRHVRSARAVLCVSCSDHSNCEGFLTFLR
jgi:hypothetical protein